MRKKRNAEALQLVGAVLKRAPRSAEVLSNYGLILAALSRHEEALACFDEALRHSAGYLNACRTAPPRSNLSHAMKKRSSLSRRSWQRSATISTR